jgi:hypothetical protein
MELDRFLNLLAAVFGGFGSIYVLKAIASLSPDLTMRLSSWHVGFSPPQIDSLAKQKADSVVGIALLVIALIMAVANLAFVPPSVRFVGWRCAIALVAALTGIAWICLNLISNAIYRKHKLAVGRLITKQRLQELFQRGRLTSDDVPSLRVYADTLLQMPVEHSKSPRQLVERLAEEVGLNVPDMFDFPPR